MKNIEDYQEAIDDFNVLAKMSFVRKSALLGRRREAPLVDERQRLAKLMRGLGYSYPAIGKAMNRDHTSIIHLVKNRKQKET